MRSGVDSNSPLNSVLPRVAPLLSLAILTLASTARAGCDGDFICINDERQDDRVILRAENLTPFPLTYTVRVRARNMTSDGSTTVTRTLAGDETHIVMALDKADPDGDGRYRYSYDWTVGDQNAVHDDNYVYRLPYESGKSYRVLQGYGSRFSHTGLEQYAIDFNMAEGTAVHAARDGVVARIEEANSIGCWDDGCGKYANYVVVLHEDGTTGEYYHLQKDGALVDVGDHVVAGQRIALSGNTGHTTMPHLHFAVYRAVERGKTQSIPVRFASVDGIIDKPRRGGHYLAAPISQARNSTIHSHIQGN